MLEKIPSLKRYKIEIVIFIFLILSLISRYLYVMPDMDEIWNYSFARRILYGQLPYRDYVLLQTPLSAQINMVFLFIFGDELIVFRTVGLFLVSILGLVIFLILRHIGNDELKSFIFICIFALLAFFYPQNNYSWYVILFLSLALYIELLKIKKLNEDNLIIFELLIGITLGLATITKQNIGMSGLLISIILTFHYCYNAKNDKLKVLFNSISIKVLGWLIIVGIEIVYFWNNNLLNIFYVKTIQDPMIFARSNAASIPYYTLFVNYAILYAVLGLITPLILILLFVKYLQAKNNQNKYIYLTILLYSIANFIMVFPRSDHVHLILASPISIIGLSLLFNRKKGNHALKLNLVRFYRFVFVIMISIFVLGFLFNINNKYNLNINHYKYIHVPKNVTIKLNEMDDFIIKEREKGKQILFLNYQAEFYLTPLNVTGLKPDKMLLSDLDIKSEKQIISKLSSSYDTLIIIRKNNVKPNRLESDTLISYVRSNMNYYTSIHEFDVYSKR